MASSPVISSNIFHKTITLPLCSLWGPLTCCDPDPLCSVALLFCSPAQPRSRSVTALCLRPKVLVQPSHFRLCLPQRKRRKEAVCGTCGPAGSQPPLVVLPQMPLPSWWPPRLTSPVSLAVQRIPTVPGIPFIISRIWVAAPFFLYPPQ